MRILQIRRKSPLRPRHTIPLLAAALVTGCVGTIALGPIASDHPANPDAASVPFKPTGLSLSSTQLGDAAISLPPPDAGTPSMHQGMDHGSMKGMDHGSMKGEDHSAMKGMDHGPMAQAEKGSPKGHDHESMKGMDHGSMKGKGHGEGHWNAPKEAQAKRNPIPANAASSSRGRELFQANCVTCHGAKGEGDGPAGAALNPRPANLKEMARHHPDGDFAWKIANGRGPMPAFKGSLTENQIWDLVNYVKSLESEGKKLAPGHDHSKHKH